MKPNSQQIRARVADLTVQRAQLHQQLDRVNQELEPLINALPHIERAEESEAKLAELDKQAAKAASEATNGSPA